MMSTATARKEEINTMLEMLPEQEQVFAYELIKRLVLAWDPDFTKVTPAEAAVLDEAIAEYNRGEFMELEDIA